LRSISHRRNLVEEQGRIHAVKRGLRGRWHLENMPWLVKTIKAVLRISPFYLKGRENALDVRIEEVEFMFDNLPPAFDGTRILFVADPHIDELEGLEDKILTITDELEYDFCVLGGDYNFGYRQENGLAYLQMKLLAENLLQKSRVFGILGNHDRFRMAEHLQKCGVEMLVNENVCIEKGGCIIYLCGVDDCHYYGADDIELAADGIDKRHFKIMLSHSPEKYMQAGDTGFSLFLAGHTHGGQVCLPGGAAMVTCATVPRTILKGKWRYNGMAGYTSRGAGASSIAVRFFCPPEITVITLKKNP
jgi:predicted MPP superfamily phosphohydrolase